MGKINCVTTNIHGETKMTEVHTYWFEDLLIEAVGRLFGHKYEWKLVHAIEKRKLRKQ